MSYHSPVLLEEMLYILNPKDQGVYVDATFGGGGYTNAILGSSLCKVIAFDKDPDAIENGKILKDKFKDRFFIIQDSFTKIHKWLIQLGVDKIDGIVFDLGVSSYQIDTPGRGFSLRFDGPLNMRMDKDINKLTALTVINSFSEKEISSILYQYGNEKYSKKIARSIIERRRRKTFDTTLELSNFIAHKIGFSKKNSEHPATKSFQAIRIFINNELNELEKSLYSCSTFLKKNSKIIAVSFHSLEDKIVKNFINKTPGNNVESRYYPNYQIKSYTQSNFKSLFKKPLVPKKEEILKNPRSRSAKLRAAYFINGEEK